MIAIGSKVTVSYIMRLQDGTEIDRTPEEEPFSFVVGSQEVFPAFEEAITGQKPGNQVSFSVDPEQGYGPSSPELVQTLPKTAFGDDANLVQGERYDAETEDGLPVSFRVIESTDDTIVADFNHPLAGQTLDLEVHILTVE